jgi:hypothetical protein
MSIIVENQNVTAAVCLDAGCLEIDFAEDACFTRSETVLVDLMQRSIGIIFQNGYHHIGDLPAHLASTAMEGMRNARLIGHGAGGREIVLHAPVKIV